jgi:hypothetical protein
MAELFGFEISRKKDQQDLVSFAPKETDDGAMVVTAGGTYGTYLDMEGSAKTEAELVVKYREMALQPECEKAIDEVTNEAIVKEGDEQIVTLDLDGIPELSDKLKKIIQDEFSNITRLLNFNNYGYEIFRRWYIDGRLYYHVMIDENDPERGIQELRYVDPRKIRKVRLLTRERKGKVFVNRNAAEFYVYNEKGFKATGSTGMDNQGLRINPDAILHCTSGLMDKDGKQVYDGQGNIVYEIRPNPEKAFNLFQSVVEYHVPKLARSEISGPNGGAIETAVVDLKGLSDTELVQMQTLLGKAAKPE